MINTDKIRDLNVRAFIQATTSSSKYDIGVYACNRIDGDDDILINIFFKMADKVVELRAVHHQDDEGEVHLTASIALMAYARKIGHNTRRMILTRVQPRNA